MYVMYMYISMQYVQVHAYICVCMDSLTVSVVVVADAAVLYAYEQCLLCYGQCAEIWYEAALYLQRASETGVSFIAQHSSLPSPFTSRCIYFCMGG